jgi:RHS repeat-associated protein
MNPAAKGETLSPSSGSCVLFSLAAFDDLAENSRPGLGTAGNEPRRGFEQVNSRTSLEMRGALYDEGIRSRCTGKQRDSESGNDYFGTRYYGSSLGRFMTPDWSASAQAVPYAEFGDPQSLNLYTYVRNNPLSRIDADGHKDWCAGSGAGTLACGVQTAWNNIHGIGSSPSQAPRTATTHKPSIIAQIRAFFSSDIQDPQDRYAIGLGILKNILTGNSGDSTVQDVLPNTVTIGPSSNAPNIPLKVLNVLDSIDATGSAGQNVQGGRDFQNREGRLPPTDGGGNEIKYTEWDVNQRQAGVGRGTERLVTGSDGSAYYTTDHYQTFQKIR